MHVLNQRPSIFGESMFISSLVAFARGVLIVSFLPLDLSTALAMPPMVNTDVSIVVTSCGEVRWKGDHDCWSAVHHLHIKLTESHMDETCRGNHEWTFELNSTYKRAPRGGIEFCKQCGCLSELTQTQVQGECEYGASFNPEGRLLWKAHMPNWREPSTHPSEIRARTNVDQVFGIMHQDGLPKRRIAQREGCSLFIMLILVATVVARGPTESSARTGRRTGAINF